MTKALYFDCFSGISGDMTFGALLDLGLDQEQVFSELSKLGIEGYNIKTTKTSRYAISGTDLEVNIHTNDDSLYEHAYHHEHGQEEHPCEHERNHHDHHGHGHIHKQQKDHHHHEERNLTMIKQIITESGISQRAKQIATEIFAEIAAAEGRVHNKPAEEVHFHEVGAIDSIIDIVGTAICIDMLGVESFFCSRLQEGSGFVHCRHGKLPVPVPAVLQMLEDSKLTIRTENIEGELITPTGIGIVKVLAGSSGSMPPMQIKRIGYGFGKRDTGRLNALRLVLGELEREDTDHAYDGDEICEIKTNLDDMTGEELGFLSEILLENGALDVFYTAVQMKKNRPGVLLTVLADKQSQNRLSEIILRHSTAIGVRLSGHKRQKLFRQSVSVQIQYGEVTVKKSYSKDGKIIRFAPEYEDCQQIAKDNDLTVKEVWELARQAAEGLKA